MSEEAVEYTWEWLDEEKTGVNINHFWVDPEKREKGYGSQTLQSLLNTFENQGAEYVVVNMSGGDESAEFLRRNNFSIIEVKSDGHVTAEYEFEENAASGN